MDHVRPAVLVATEGTYTHPDVEEIEKHYKARVVILDRMVPRARMTVPRRSAPVSHSATTATPLRL